MQFVTTSRPSPEPRDAYRHFTTLSTRWMDNDIYGHVNNAAYYSLFDTALNTYLIQSGALDIHQGGVIGLMVENHCNYFSPLAFPQPIDVGLRVGNRGATSVRYEIGLFAHGEALCAARGHLIHVYVDRATRRPAPLPEALIQALQRLIDH